LKSKSRNLIYLLLKSEGWSSGDILKHFIFTFLYSALAACFIYLMGNDTTGAIIYFAIFFIVGLLKPGWTREPKPTKSKASKILSFIVYFVVLFLMVFFTVFSTASVMSKIGAWLILFIIYLIEKIEKKYFTSDSTSSD
jgi:hypothetical protein